MTTIERKKLEQVLEALTYCEALNKDVEQQKMQAITAIREALAQPAQEPVTHQFQALDGSWHPFIDAKHKANTETDDSWPIRALYTTPQQQEPRNFCPRCGKRTADLTVIHTCTPPEGGHQ